MNDRVAGQFGLAGFMLRLIFRGRLKLLAFGVLLAVIAFLLAGTALLGRAVEESATIWRERLGADLMVLPAGTELRLEQGLLGGIPVRFALPEGIEAAVAAMPGIRLVAPQYFLSSARSACCEAGNLLLVGFDPDRDFTVRPWLRGDSGAQPGDGAVLIGGGVMKAKGADLRLYNQTFTVAARLERSGMGYFDNAVFIPLPGIAAMERSSRSSGSLPFTITWGRPSLLLVQLAPQTPVQETAALLQEKIPGLKVLTIPELFRDKREKLARFTALLTPLTVAAWLLAIAAGAALQILYWRERRPLLGLLQAWGWHTLHLLAFFGLEVLLLSLVGMVAGSLGALVLLKLAASSCAAILGLPLLLGSGLPAIAGLAWLWLAFAGSMTAATVLILLFMLQREPAALIRGN